MKDDLFVENSKSQKTTLAGFSQRGSHIIILLISPYYIYGYLKVKVKPVAKYGNPYSEFVLFV